MAACRERAAGLGRAWAAVPPMPPPMVPPARAPARVIAHSRRLVSRSAAQMSRRDTSRSGGGRRRLQNAPGFRRLSWRKLRHARGRERRLDDTLSLCGYSGVTPVCERFQIVLFSAMQVAHFGEYRRVGPTDVHLPDARW